MRLILHMPSQCMFFLFFLTLCSWFCMSNSQTAPFRIPFFVARSFVNGSVFLSSFFVDAGMDYYGSLYRNSESCFPQKSYECIRYMVRSNSSQSKPSSIFIFVHSIGEISKDSLYKYVYNIHMNECWLLSKYIDVDVYVCLVLQCLAVAMMDLVFNLWFKLNYVIL